MAKTILVIEDDESTRSLYVEVLREAGYEVVPLASGMDAIQYVLSKKADLVLTDMRMGSVSGDELIPLFEHHSLHLPVIIVSGYAQSRETMMKSHKNVKEFLVKPVDLERLVRVVAEVLEKRCDVKNA
jgi:DNA-binding NtrC family response regulator